MSTELTIVIGICVGALLAISGIVAAIAYDVARIEHKVSLMVEILERNAK